MIAGWAENHGESSFFIWSRAGMSLGLYQGMALAVP
jgi:hypothetical protein